MLFEHHLKVDGLAIGLTICRLNRGVLVRKNLYCISQKPWHLTYLQHQPPNELDLEIASEVPPQTHLIWYYAFMEFDWLR
mmetsp:Transcript_31224/g.65441  ORF Transcript_31224/g.65441 Transcript_31224/m.65441 type:complete len:80 (-) Transcript_31224:3085-3324(-)